MSLSGWDLSSSRAALLDVLNNKLYHQHFVAPTRTRSALHSVYLYIEGKEASTSLDSAIKGYTDVFLGVGPDKYVGDVSSRHAPLWTKELAIGKEHPLHIICTYV